MLVMKTKIDPFCQAGKKVIETELQAIQALSGRIGEDFSKACQLMLDCQGRVIVIGMGKSGHIGRKIAATFASTGTPAFFVHPGEANHGDMGMVTHKDVILAISNSGETPEMVNIFPLIKRIEAPLIAMTGNHQSSMAQMATIHLDISVQKEACSLGLAPTSSTTVSLVMGDAIAIALLETRGFTSDDFARFHPGGMLGKRLLLQVQDIMHTGNAVPIVQQNCPLDQALIEITEKSLGMTAVIDTKGILIGIFTDGDLRRTLDQNHDIHRTVINKVMTQNSITIKPTLLARDALSIMHDNKVTSLLITDHENRPIGAIHMHDLLRAGIA
jgi:arabinose-5-phosphate isomerase